MALDYGEVSARVQVGELGVTPNARRTSPEARAAADRLKEAKAKKTPTTALEEEAVRNEAAADRAKVEADKKQIDPAAREKFLKEEAGEIPPRELPPGTRPGELTRLSQLNEKLINKGYDALTAAEKTRVKASVEKSLSKDPALKDILDNNPTQKDEILEAYLRDINVRADIRGEQDKAINPEGLVKVKVLLDALSAAETNVKAKEAEIAENDRKRNNARLSIRDKVVPAGESPVELNTLRDAEDNLRTEQQKSAKTTRELTEIDSRIAEFDAGGVAANQLDAAQALLNDPDYSDAAIARAVAAEQNLARERTTLIDQITSIKPIKGTGGVLTMLPERAALQAELRNIQRREGIEHARIVKFNAAKETIERLKTEKRTKEERRDVLNEQKIIDARSLAEARRREIEARGPAKSAADSAIDKFDEDEIKLKEDLEGLKKDKAVAQAIYEHDVLERQGLIKKRLESVVENGVDNYIRRSFAEAAAANDIFLQERLAKATGRVDKALLRMYQSRWVQPGVRGPAVGGGRIGIPRLGIGRFGIGGGGIDVPRVGMTREVAAPNEAVIRADFADLLSRGALAPRGELERMLNETRVWQQAEVVAGRLAREDVLTPRDIQEHLDNKEALDTSSRETAARIISARMKLGKLSQLEQTQLENLVDYEWAHGEKGVIDMAMKINLDARTRLMDAKARGETQKEFMDYVNKFKNDKNSKGIITLLALLIGGVVPAGVAWYAMSQRDGDAASAGA